MIPSTNDSNFITVLNKNNLGISPPFSTKLGIHLFKIELSDGINLQSYTFTVFVNEESRLDSSSPNQMDFELSDNSESNIQKICDNVNDSNCE